MKLSWTDVLQSVFQRVAEEHGDGARAVYLADEIERWPPGMLEGLCTARLIERGQPATSLVCRECDEGCRRTAEIVEQVGQPLAMTTCHLILGFGPFLHPITRLDRWISTRKLVAKFVATQLGRTLPKSDGADVRFRFDLMRFGSHRRLVSLEFDGVAQLYVGGRRADLIELIVWRGRSLSLNQDVLEILASEAPDLQSGGKREQPSAIVQRDKKLGTEIQYRKLQRAADKLFAENPKRTKEQVARALAKDEEFRDMSSARIERVIRKPEKQRRKKNA